MNYTDLAAEDLNRMFGRGAPFALVQSGRCTLNDWLRVLDARRAEFEVSFSNQAQEVKSANVVSHVRLAILGAISRDGMLAVGLKASTLEREVQRLQDDGLIERSGGGFRLTRRGQRALNALRHTSSPIPFEPAQPSADQAQINAA